MTPLQPSLHTARFNLSTIGTYDFRSIDKIIIAGSPDEARGKIPLWQDLIKQQHKKIIWVSPSTERSEIIIETSGKKAQKLSLRDEGRLRNEFQADTILIDISGLPHNIWAPLLKYFYNDKICFLVLYAEPDNYTLHSSPASASLFDLSTSFNGMAPLPGFAILNEPNYDKKSLFISLLGFEGNRPERLALQLDPAPDKVIPIIGVPGFKIDFPTHTVTCNRNFLKEYCDHSDIRYARASCPFEVYDVLSKIHEDYKDHYMYIAPVGTKPHSLGAIWYAINHSNDTEILYDNPERKKGRTKGIGIIHIYDFR